MATEEDNFDIDIYGDGGEDYREEGQVEPDEATQSGETTNQAEVAEPTSGAYPRDESIPNGNEAHKDIKSEPEHDEADVAHKIGSTDELALDPVQLPKQAPQTQGLKRKEGADDRFVDPGAMPALYISELPWWITDDDIRGWANQSECEDELEDITFSEHKVNGKSKGYDEPLGLQLHRLTLLTSSQAGIYRLQDSSSGDGSQAQNRRLR